MNAKPQRVRGAAGSAMARIAVGTLLAWMTGCASHGRIFTVISHPPGARIFVDEVEKGRTDTERLAVDFGASPWRSLRVEKDGYQPEGLVLHPGVREERLEFHLKKAPDPQRILQRLDEIQIELRRLAGQLAALREEQARQERARRDTYRDEELPREGFEEQ